VVSLQGSKLVLRFGDSVRVSKSRFQNGDQGSEVHKFDSIITDVGEDLIESVATEKGDSETKAGLTIEVCYSQRPQRIESPAG
jgi:hypothetical protein